MGPARVSDIKAAGEDILAIVRAREGKGEIVVGSEEPDDGLLQ